MYYIIGDIGNTSTRICLLKKSKILKSYIFDTKNIFLRDYIKKILNRLLKKTRERNIIFVCCSFSFKKIKQVLKKLIIKLLKLSILI